MNGKMLCILTGRLGQDPETRSTGNGNTMVTLSVATEEYDGKDGNGKAIYKTVWWNVTSFGKTAEYIKNYLNKGDGIYIRGTIKVTEKDDKKYVNVIADEVDQLFEASRMMKRESGSNSNKSSGNKNNVKQADVNDDNDGFDLDEDDDLPF